MNDLYDKLIAKLEASPEGSRELDANCMMAGVNWDRGEFNDMALRVGILNYTTSLDAALTLVPEAYDEELKRARHRRGWYAALWLPSRIGQTGDAATAALALCIAALKAIKHDLRLRHDHQDRGNH